VFSAKHNYVGRGHPHAAIARILTFDGPSRRLI
jgi:hypothetical protein